MRVRLFPLFVMCLVCAFSAHAQLVDEVGSSAILNKTTAEISLAIQNTSIPFEGTINLELLDPQGTIRATSTQNVQIRKKKHTYKIAMPIGDLMKTAGDELAWYRLCIALGAPKVLSRYQNC